MDALNKSCRLIEYFEKQATAATTLNILKDKAIAVAFWDLYCYLPKA